MTDAVHLNVLHDGFLPMGGTDVQAIVEVTGPGDRLRLWTPQGGETLFVRQVAPVVRDLTDGREPLDERTADYPTGSGAAEARAYHVVVRVAPQPTGTRQMVARVQVVGDGEVLSSARVVAEWSDDAARTTRIAKATGPVPPVGAGAPPAAEPPTDPAVPWDLDLAAVDGDLADELRQGGERRRALLARLVQLDDTDTVGLRRRTRDGEGPG